MPRTTPRPFNLGDLMALVATVAVGFALQRWVTASIHHGLSMQPANSRWSTVYLGSWVDILCLGKPSQYAWAATLGLVACRWRRPRPPARRLLRQPGAVACLAVVAATPLGFALYWAQVGLHVADPDSPLFLRNNLAWDAAARWAAPAVVGSWVALALGGRWSPERSWLDRAGRILGCFWMIHLPISQLAGPFFLLYLGTDDHHPLHP